MSALALVETGGEPRVDSRALAGELGNRHRHVVRLIDRYEAKFAEFGIVRFENAEITGRGRPERFALLNEDQSYFLLSLSRNTERVVDLKAKLVSAFSDARTGVVRRGLGFFHKRLALEVRDANSKVKASFGSKLLHQRRRELPVIRSERAELDAAMQPDLLTT